MKKKTSKKNRMMVILLLAVLLAGLSLLLYPTVADYWNSMHQSKAIASYMEAVTELDDDAYDELWEEARAYNASLLEATSRFEPGEEDQQRYEQLLNISGDGIMGYLEIPSIDVSLPVYHGTSDEVLQVAVGHIEGLPCRQGGRVPTVWSLATGGFLPPGCSPIWISWGRETCSSFMCWGKRSLTKWTRSTWLSPMMLRISALRKTKTCVPLSPVRHTG